MLSDTKLLHKEKENNKYKKYYAIQWVAFLLAGTKIASLVAFILEWMS